MDLCNVYDPAAISGVDGIGAAKRAARATAHLASHARRLRKLNPGRVGPTRMDYYGARPISRPIECDWRDVSLLSEGAGQHCTNVIRSRIVRRDPIALHVRSDDTHIDLVRIPMRVHSTGS